MVYALDMSKKSTYRTKRVPIMVTPHEHREWKAFARTRGMSIAALVRTAVADRIAAHPLTYPKKKTTKRKATKRKPK